MQFKKNAGTGGGISYRNCVEGDWFSGTDPVGLLEYEGVTRMGEKDTKRKESKKIWSTSRQDLALLLLSLHFFFSSLSFLGTFTKLWKATIIFRMSIRLSVRLVQLGYN